MEQRPNSNDDMLSKDALSELRHRLALLHGSSVERFYMDAYARCGLVAGQLPQASAIQELVTAWKQLRRWKSEKRSVDDRAG